MIDFGVRRLIRPATYPRSVPLENPVSLRTLGFFGPGLVTVLSIGEAV